MTTYGLDTNVLRKLIDHFYEIRELPLIFQNSNNRFFISYTSLCELIDNPDKVQREKVLSTLVKIKLDLDWRLRISKEWKFIFKDEVNHPIHYQPSIGKNHENQLWEKIKKHAISTNDSFRQRKEQLLDIDTFAVKHSPMYDSNKVLDLLKNYSGPTIWNEKFELLENWFPHWKRNLLNSKQHPAIWSWLSLSEFYVLGLLINKDIKAKIGKLAHGTGKDRGFHHDILIYSELIYCDIFLTLDDKLAQTEARLASIGCLKSKIEAPDWIK